MDSMNFLPSYSCSLPVQIMKPQDPPFFVTCAADDYSGPAEKFIGTVPDPSRKISSPGLPVQETKSMHYPAGSFKGLSGFRIMPTVPGPVKATLTIVFPESSPLDLVYTNDLHGAISPMKNKDGGLEGGMAYVARKISELKEEAGGHALVLDGGDWTQGTMESNLSKGRVMTDIMNSIGYDAMEIGNHEFDWGPQNLTQLIEHTKVPLLGANIANTDGAPLKGVNPSIIRTIDGVKVGILGLIAEDTPQNADPANLKGIHILNIKETAERQIGELKKAGAELIVVLSHNGDRNDEELARAVKGIDIIVGGHSHSVIEEPRKVGTTLIVQAGTQGRQVGHAKLTLQKQLTMDAEAHADNYPFSLTYTDYSGKEPVEKSISMKSRSEVHCSAVIASCTNEIIPIRPGKDAVPDAAVDAIMKKALEDVKSRSQRVLGTLGLDLPHDRLQLQESPMGDFLTDALRAETKSDIAFQTSSGIRDSLNQGPLKYGDLYRIFPFDNVTVTVDLTGEQVRKVLEHSALQEKEYLQVSGISMDIDRKKPEGERISGVKVNGEPLDQGKTYRVAINDLLYKGGFGYKEFTNGQNAEFGKLQRDHLADYIKNTSLLNIPLTAGRLNFSM
jgi:5'-nucleotidase / UDP-sugar diphosphatase